jgi:hypothetical protein
LSLPFFALRHSSSWTTVPLSFLKWLIFSQNASSSLKDKGVHTDEFRSFFLGWPLSFLKWLISSQNPSSSFEDKGVHTDEFKSSFLRWGRGLPPKA